MTTVKVGEKYQVVIPREIREKIHLKKHSRLSVSLENDRIVMTVPDVAALRGIGRGYSVRGTPASYVSELRAEWETRDRT